MPRVHGLEKHYIDKKLQKLIKEKMAGAGVTQERLAREIGTSQQNVSWMLTDGHMSARELVIALNVCEVSAEEFERVMRYKK